MGHIEATKNLTAGPEAVWATIVDPRTWHTWFTVHEKWMEKDGMKQLDALASAPA